MTRRANDQQEVYPPPILYTPPTMSYSLAHLLEVVELLALNPDACPDCGVPLTIVSNRNAKWEPCPPCSRRIKDYENAYRRSRRQGAPC